MNDLIPAGLKNAAFVLAATLAGWGFYAIGLTHEVADLVGHLAPAVREQVAIILVPLVGVGVAEFLGGAFFQAWAWQHSPVRLQRFLQGGCPDLSGVWDVTWQSNDSVNKTLHDVYVGRAQPTTPLDKIALQEYTGRIEVVATPAEVRVALRKATVTDANSSTVARLFRESNGDVILVYESRPSVHAPTARDSATYNFAARLRFDEASGELSGHYWTDRGLALGQNAAGYMTARRASTTEPRI
jgi:hypothetical protein